MMFEAFSQMYNSCLRWLKIQYAPIKGLVTKHSSTISVSEPSATASVIWLGVRDLDDTSLSTKKHVCQGFLS